MGRNVLVSVCVAVVAGCGLVPGVDPIQGEARDGGISTDILVRPQARPEGFAATVAPSLDPAAQPRPAPGANTAETFDTTTQAQRAAASAPKKQAVEIALGRTVGSLGSPAEPGFWMKTTLVSREREGRVVYPVTGKSVQVTLMPIDGPPTAGSRLSLSAMRLLEAPLTGLPELDVFADS